MNKVIYDVFITFIASQCPYCVKCEHGTYEFYVIPNVNFGGHEES